MTLICVNHLWPSDPSIPNQHLSKLFKLVQQLQKMLMKERLRLWLFFDSAETKTVDVLTSGIETWSPTKLSISLDVHSFFFAFLNSKPSRNFLNHIYHISLHSGLQQSSWNLFKIYDLSAHIICCKQTAWFLSSIWLGRKGYNHHYKGVKDGADDRDVENDRLTSDSNHWWSLFNWFSPSDFRWWTAVLSSTGWVHGSTSGQPRLSRCFFKGNWKVHCCNVPCELWKRNTPTSNPEVICFVGIPASTNMLIQSSWFGPLCPFLWDTVMRHMWGCYLKVYSCPLVYWRTAFGCGRRIWLSWPIIAWSFHSLPSVESEWTSRKQHSKYNSKNHLKDERLAAGFWQKLDLSCFCWQLVYLKMLYFDMIWFYNVESPMNSHVVRGCFLSKEWHFRLQELQLTFCVDDIMMISCFVFSKQLPWSQRIRSGVELRVCGGGHKSSIFKQKLYKSLWITQSGGENAWRSSVNPGCLWLKSQTGCFG